VETFQKVVTYNNIIIIIIIRRRRLVDLKKIIKKSCEKDYLVPYSTLPRRFVRL
jgi:hypothetical protein